MKTVEARIGVAVGLAFAAAWFGACTPLRMAAPSDVQADSEVFEAKGRAWASGTLVDESFRLGPFSVEGVERGATHGRASTSYERVGFLALRQTEHEELQGGYSYRIVEDGAEVRAECRSFTSRKKSSQGRWEVSEQASRLACECAGDDGTSTLELHLSGRNPQGTLTLGERTLEVKSVRTATGALAPAEPVGFRVDGADGPVGAVEVLRPGRIWPSRKLGAAERRNLACLLTGVMLHEED